MKGPARVLRTFCALFGLISSGAHAYCPGDAKYYSVGKEFGRSKFVIVGTADRETWIGEDGKSKPLRPPFQFGGPRPWGFDPYEGAFYDVRVQQSFKGAAPKHVRLFSENSTARFWLKTGRSYVLFVTTERFAPVQGPRVGLQLTIDTCGNSTEVAAGAGLMAELQQLAARPIR